MVLAFKPSKKKLSPLPPYNNGRPEKSSIASARGTKRKRSPSRTGVSANVAAEEVPPVGELEDVFVETTHASEARETRSLRRVRTNINPKDATLKHNDIVDKGKQVLRVLDLY